MPRSTKDVRALKPADRAADDVADAILDSLFLSAADVLHQRLRSILGSDTAKAGQVTSISSSSPTTASALIRRASKSRFDRAWK